MAQKALQKNNGSPKGYGQPARPQGRRRAMDDILLRDEERQLYGEPEPPPQEQDAGRGQPPQVYPPPPPMRSQPVGPATRITDPRATDTHTGLGLPQGQQPQQTPGVPQGLAQAFQQSVQNNFGDIQDTNPWQTGQFIHQLSGFNTGGWGSGERGTGTLKNRFGQVASNYDVSKPGALQQLLQDPRIREMLPNASIVEHPNQDLFDPDGPQGPLEPVDVIQSATAGGAGAAWAWQPTGGGPGGPGAQAYMAGLPPMFGGAGDVMQSQPVGGPEQMPQVNDEQTAMEFLNWLMSQQQQQLV